MIDHVPIWRILKNDYLSFLLLILAPMITLGVAVEARKLSSGEREWGFTIAAILAMACGWLLWARVQRIRRGLQRGQRVPATIDSMWWDRDRGRIEYSYTYGTLRRAGVAINKSPDTAALKAGDAIDVILDPQRPDKPLVLGLYLAQGFRSAEAADNRFQGKTGRDSLVLPTFVYHPDPIATGAIVPSGTSCSACGRARGYVYSGLVYGTIAPGTNVCPWCIADGSASATLHLQFHDPERLFESSITATPRLPEEIVARLCTRTPGFGTGDDAQWFVCCSDAAAFLGPAGKRELESRWPEAIPLLQEDLDLFGEEWDAVLEALERDCNPRAYVFRCLHCQKYGAYVGDD